LALGGFDETACKFGRTQEDNEFGARWLIAYGPKSAYFGPSISWHFTDRHLEERKLKRPTPESRMIFARTLGEFYNQHYFLYSYEAVIVPTHANIAPEEPVPGSTFDVRVPLPDVSWMPGGEVREVLIHPPKGFALQDYISLFADLTRKLKDGGRVIVGSKDPEVLNLAHEAMDQVGLEFENQNETSIEGVLSLPLVSMGEEDDPFEFQIEDTLQYGQFVPQELNKETK